MLLAVIVFMMGRKRPDADGTGDAYSPVDRLLHRVAFKTYRGHLALADSDRDGLSDFAEVVVHGTDPNSADSDGDGVSDADEVASQKSGVALCTDLVAYDSTDPLADPLETRRPTFSSKIDSGVSGQYRWRLTGRNTAGIGPVSDWETFSVTVAAPGQPQVWSPDGRTLDERRLVLVWTDVMPVTDYYIEIQRARGRSWRRVYRRTLSHGEWSSTNGLATWAMTEPLRDIGEYRWSVRALNQKVIGPTGAVVNTFPMELQWMAVPGTVKYEWSVYRESSGVMRLWLRSLVTDGSTAFLLPQVLEDDRGYEWRIRAWDNQQRSGPWSTASFLPTD